MLVKPAPATNHPNMNCNRVCTQPWVTDAAQCRAEPTCEHYFTGSDKPHLEYDDDHDLTDASQTKLTDFCKTKCDQPWAESKDQLWPVSKGCESWCEDTRGSEFEEAAMSACEVHSLVSPAIIGGVRYRDQFGANLCDNFGTPTPTMELLGEFQGVVDAMGYRVNDESPLNDLGYAECAGIHDCSAQWKDSRWNFGDTLRPKMGDPDGKLSPPFLGDLDEKLSRPKMGDVKFTCNAAACANKDPSCRTFCDSYSKMRTLVESKKNDLPQLRQEMIAQYQAQDAAAAAQAKADAARKVREQAMQAKIAAGTQDQQKYCKSVCAIFKTE